MRGQVGKKNSRDKNVKEKTKTDRPTLENPFGSAAVIVEN